MKNTFLTFLTLLSVCYGLQAQPTATPHSTYYYQRKTLFESLPDGEGEIVFIGDSMTDGGEWSELLGNPHVKNRGISGDVTRGVLDRLEEVTASAPDRVFVLIGTNDLARGISVHTVIENIGHIVRQINRASSYTKVFVQSIFPVNDHFGMFAGHTSKSAAIRAINAALARGIGGDYRYLDLHSTFVDAEGKLNIRYTNDGLHLNGKGYRHWADHVATYVTEN